MRPHERTVPRALALVLGLLAGCTDAPGDPPGRAAAALTVGPELTLLPDLPGASAPIEPLGHAATAATTDVRATAWRTVTGSGSVAFWSTAGGLLSIADLGSDVLARPLVATDGRIFLVVWHGPLALVAVRFDADGTRLDATPFVVSPTNDADVPGDAVACVYDGRDFALAYNLGSMVPFSVEVARVTTAGAVRDRRVVPLLGATSHADRLRITHSSSGYLVAATGFYSASFRYLQLAYGRLDANLAPLDPTARVIAATPRERILDDVATDGTDYLLLWSDEATPTANASRLLAARVPASTGVAATAVDVGPGTPPEPLGAAWAERVPGGYLIARYDARTLTTRQLRDTGAPVEAAPVARAVGAGLTGEVARVRVGADVALTWATSTSSGTQALATATLAPDGSVRTPTSQPLTIPGGTDAEAIGLDWDASNFVAAWGGLGSWASRVSRAGARVDPRGVAVAAGYTDALAGAPGQHLLVHVTSPPGEFGTRYSAQRRDANLAVVGTETVVFGAERPAGFLGAGGPIGYLLSPGVAYLPGLSRELKFLGTDGALVRSVTLFSARYDYPPVAFAASRAVWAVATSRNDMLGCVLIVQQFTPTGEFAAVPLEMAVTAPACASNRGVAVASDGADFLVSWTGSTTAQPMYGLRVRGDGSAIDAAPFRIAESGGAPRSVWDGRAYTVAWTPPVGTARTTPQPILAARVTAGGAVLDATPAVLVSGLRSSTPFALAADGAGTLAVAYGRTSTGGVVRAQVRVFTWDAVAADGGVDAGTDLGAVDVATADVGVNDVATADVATVDAAHPDAATDAAPNDAAPNDATAAADVAAAADVSDATADAATPPGGGSGCSAAGTPAGGPAAPGAPAILASLVGLAFATRRKSPPFKNA